MPIGFVVSDRFLDGLDQLLGQFRANRPLSQELLTPDQFPGFFKNAGGPDLEQ